ncbi:hypothetical protein IFO70_37785 [Phormidium tenue FACHB-886]|nr:hypothetical protein [Phormidium tenue FACHB-886]
MEITKKTYVGDANRVFEPIVAALPEDEILNLMRQRGFEVKDSAYPSIITILKDLISQRPR